jgi:hypothetical protein
MSGTRLRKRLPVLVGSTWSVLCTMNLASIEIPSGWWPDANVLLLYAICFGAGWLLHGAPEAWPELRFHWKRRLLAALACLLLSLLLALVHFDGQRLGHERTWAFASAQLCTAEVIWQFSFGRMGTAEQCVRSEHASVPWPVDASYWVYLVHLPLAVHLVAACAVGMQLFGPS